MVGELIGNFRVIAPLGKGGMGEVWLAEHKDIKTRVAIKLLQPQVSADEQQVERFFNEGVAVSKIRHPGIVRISDYGRHEGRAYLVMELLEGEPLSRRVRRAGRLPVERVCDIARQIAGVLEATHAAGIIHRDLKPDNVFVVPDAELPSGERVKVLDFGIAKLTHSAIDITGTANAMGTPAYMSPEQWRASGKVDGRADVYSLGCLAFELATGKPPFVCASVGDACDKHLHAPPPSARALVPELPAALDNLLAQLLAKRPEDRPDIAAVKAAFAGFGAPSPSGSLTMPAIATPAVGSEPPPARIAAETVTTMSGSAAQATVPPTAVRARRPYVAMWLAGAALIAVGAVVIALRSTGEDVDRPVAASPSIHLHVITNPPNAEVRVDTGALGPDHVLVVAPDRANKHSVEVAAAGYVPETHWVALDEDLTLQVDLKPVPVEKPSLIPPTTPPATAAKPPKPPAPLVPTVTEPPKGAPRPPGPIITTYDER
jgi:tRNA A-37 threonylcarbamoyl transferase component Bud32